MIPNIRCSENTIIHMYILSSCSIHYARFAPSFVFCVSFCRSLFVFLSLFWSLFSVFLRFPDSYYPVGISKLFLMTIPGSTSIHKININSCHKSNTMAAISGAGTPYPSRSHEFIPGFQLGSFCSIFSYLRRSLFVLFPLAIVLSNFSYNK